MRDWERRAKWMDVDAELYINGVKAHSFKSFLPSFKQGGTVGGK